MVRGFIPAGLRSGPGISKLKQVYDCFAAERG
jgi:hypothetical protein